MHNKIKEMMIRLMIIEKVTGEICSSKIDLEVWTEYVEQMYSDGRRGELLVESAKRALEITENELEYAIK